VSDARSGVDPLLAPVIVVAPPRSGARLISQALAAVHATWGVTSEPGALLAGVPELDPPDGDRSGRLIAADCQPGIRHRLRAYLRSRCAGPLDTAAPRRLFDASPRNALLVPFIDAVFPDAMFVYVHRRPVDSLAESLVAWRAGSAATYPALPGWQGPTWSFLLVPGWQQLIGRPLAEVVTEQWVRTMQMLTVDLDRLPPSRWCVADHDSLMRNPEAELTRLLRFLDLDPSAAPAAVRSLSPSRLAAPVARSAHEELAPYFDRARELTDHARDWIANTEGGNSDQCP